jgi:hypothetical protein
MLSTIEEDLQKICFLRDKKPFFLSVKDRETTVSELLSGETQ